MTVMITSVKGVRRTFYNVAHIEERENSFILIGGAPKTVKPTFTLIVKIEVEEE